jgi:hypothetical protein
VADISPAQKIVAAFNERHELCGPFDDDWVEQCLAAALRAAADQVAPEEPWPVSMMGPVYVAEAKQRRKLRSELFTIATELETRQ